MGGVSKITIIHGMEIFWGKKWEQLDKVNTPDWGIYRDCVIYF